MSKNGLWADSCSGLAKNRAEIAAPFGLRRLW